MKLTKMTAILSILLSIFSCNLSHDGNENKKRIEYSWSGDSILVKKEYYNDTIQSIISFQKDTITREDKSMFYDNGRLVREMYYDNGKLAGNDVEYYQNGSPKMYICHDSYGDTIFLRRYDINGKIINEKGIISVQAVVNRDDLKGKKIARYNSFIVTPPHTSVTVNNFCLYNDFKDTLQPIDEIRFYDWEHVYTFKIPKPGTYKYKQVTLIMDSIKRKGYRFTDTLTSTFNW